METYSRAPCESADAAIFALISLRSCEIVGVDEAETFWWQFCWRGDEQENELGKEGACRRVQRVEWNALVAINRGVTYVKRQAVEGCRRPPSWVLLGRNRMD